MVSETGSPDIPDHPNDFRPPTTRGGEAHPNQPNSVDAKLQLTREEIRALKECNQESFWYRCVPLSIALATTTHLAVQRGLLKGHPTRGALGKNLAAIGLGYVLGKWSYQKVCREKILALENSPLADAFRRQQHTKHGGSFTDVVSETLSFPNTDGQTASYPSNSTDDYQNNEINTDSNARYIGLDDSKRPNLDTDAGDSPLRYPGRDKQSTYTSYEELRKKNRDDYVVKNTTPSTRLPQSNHQPVMPHRPDVNQQPAPPRVYTPQDSPSKPKHTKRNQYGDVWDE
ncbi:OCIA domain-containing protein 1-like [Lineus longissimus]|uniref:OCIA domain-containing protein 1-like n=1 Tax=Lineus longissimus TaxID=88925 RepID=UPI002B4C70DC